MKPPVRWHDDPEAPEDLRVLLRSAPRSRRLPKEVLARSAARVDRLLVVPAAAGVLFWFKAVALAASVAGFGAVLVARALPGRGATETVSVPSFSRRSVPTAARPLPTPPATPSVSPTASALPSSSAASVVARSPGPVATAVPGRSAVAAPLASTRAGETRAADPTGDDPLVREAALLESARADLGVDPARALATLGLHASEFPAGVLAMEREVLTIEALQRLGRIVEAGEGARALLARSRGSPYERRIEAIVDSARGP